MSFQANTSEYRSSAENENSNSRANHTKTSYNTVAKTPITSNVPKRNQAIILDISDDDLRLSDYVIGVGSIIGPKNILSASRIANNRICIYLDSQQLVDDIVKNHQTILIKEKHVKIRKLITPAKRIIISNVCSSIPNYLIEDFIKNLGYRLVSPITTLRAGIPGEEYAHIESFRRQVFVAPPCEDTVLPSSTIVTYEDTAYRIFLNFDELVCFLCKNSGHIANRCPSLTSVSNSPQSEAAIAQNTNLSLTSLNENQIENTHEERNFSGSQNAETQNSSPLSIQLASLPKQEPQKRVLSSSVTSETIDSAVEEPPKIPNQESVQISAPASQKKTKQNSTPQKSKKLRKSSSVESLPSEQLAEQLQSVKDIVTTQQSNFVIPFECFKDFLENCYNNPDPLTEARRYTEDIQGLLKMLHDTYPYLNNRSLKNRYTRIQNKIKRCLDHNSNSSESEIESSISKV